jgi:hypothetical protein
MMADLVSCLSCVEYAERPLSFNWQDERLEVSEILSSWRTPQGKGFRVLVRPRGMFELFYDDFKDAWRIASLS